MLEKANRMEVRGRVDKVLNIVHCLSLLDGDPTGDRQTGPEQATRDSETRHGRSSSSSYLLYPTTAYHHIDIVNSI